MIQLNPNPLPLPDSDPDMPAESIRIRIDDADDGVMAWLDSLHPVYDRLNSTKGTTNPKSHHHHHHQNPNPNPNHSSQRFSGSLKATTKSQIIGLPGAAVQHSGHSARRHPPPIFAGKRNPGESASVSVSDPGSPKVSCFGKVRSDGAHPATDCDEGCWSSAIVWLRGFGRPGPALEAGIPAEEGKIPAVVDPELPPPGLGGMKRFVSGRRSASWGDDMEMDRNGGHVA